jgi:hypothetical protein
MPESNDTTKTTNGAAEDTETKTERAIDAPEMENLAADPGMTDDQGLRIETFISPRTFVTQEWCLKNVASQDRGYHVAIGTIAGYATASERRDSAMPVKPGDKPMPPSVWIKGEFEATVHETGEVKSARWLILPRAAGDLIEQAFESGAERAYLDLELGVQATGRSIPYAYTVTAYGSRDSEGRRVVRAIRAKQAQRALARQESLRLAGPGAAPAAPTIGKAIGDPA